MAAKAAIHDTCQQAGRCGLAHHSAGEAVATCVDSRLRGNDVSGGAM